MSLARVYIANSIPRYFTEGAWDELDWLEIDGVTSLGAVGRAPKSASFRPVDAPAMMHYETAPAQHELVIECQDQRGPVNDRLNASVLSRQEKAFRIVYEAADGCHGPEGAEVTEHLIGPVIAYRSGAAEVETAAKRMVRVAINGVFNAVQPVPVPPPPPPDPEPETSPCDDFGVPGVALDFPWTVVVDSDRKVAFIADYGTDRLVSVDVSDNNNFRAIQSYGGADDYFSSWFMELDTERNILFASAYDYVTTAPGSKTLHALDVSDPSDIKELSAVYGIKSQRGGIRLDRATNLLFSVGNEERYAEATGYDEIFGGLYIHDVSNPAAIVEIGRYEEMDRFRELLNLVYDPARNLIFAIDERFDDALISFDVSNPASPTKLAELPVSSLSGEAFGMELDASTDTIYMLMYTNELISFDVGNPLNMSVLQRIPLSNAGAGIHLDAAANRLYVVIEDGVQVYDITTPSAMTLVSTTTYPSSMELMDIELATGDTREAVTQPSTLPITQGPVFYAVGYGQMMALDASDPTDLTLLVDTNLGADSGTADVSSNVSPLVNIGFCINFFGQAASEVYVNRRGNITLDSPLDSFANDINFHGRYIIAAFFEGISTSAASNAVSFEPGLLSGANSFVITWTNVGGLVSGWNTFRLTLVDRFDPSVPATQGDFDIIFNYDSIAWDKTFQGQGARVGYSAPSGTEEAGDFYQLPGSATPGAFLAGGANDLVANSLNSATPGEYIFSFRSGQPV